MTRYLIEKLGLHLGAADNLTELRTSDDLLDTFGKFHTHRHRSTSDL